MKDCFAKAAKLFTKKVDGKTIRPVICIQTPLRYGALNVSASAPAVKLALSAAKKYGIKMKAVSTGGGCDAHVLCQHGLIAPNLGIGYQECHTLKEYLEVAVWYPAAKVALEVILNYK